MKSRWFHGVALAAIAISALTAGSARADDGAHGAVSVIVSGGTRWLTPDGIWRRFAFSAKQYADNYVEGEWQLVAGSAIIHGNVVCLTVVDDHTARLGGRIENAFFTTFLPGTDIGWIAGDKGEGQQSTGDLTSNLRAFRNSPAGSAETFCSTGQLPFPGGSLGIDTIDYGNVQVIRLQ